MVHVAHRLPHEVIIMQGDHLPRCAKCKTDVLFELVHAAPDLFHTWHVLYELPVLEDDSAA